MPGSHNGKTSVLKGDTKGIIKATGSTTYHTGFDTVLPRSQLNMPEKFMMRCMSWCVHFWFCFLYNLRSQRQTQLIREASSTCIFVSHLTCNMSVKSKTMGVFKKLIGCPVTELKKTSVTQPNLEKISVKGLHSILPCKKKSNKLKSNQILPVAFENVWTFGSRLGKTASFLLQQFLRQFTWLN